MTTNNWQHFHYLWAAQEALFLLTVVFVIAIVKESLFGMIISVIALIGLLWLFRSDGERRDKGDGVSPEDAVLAPCTGMVLEAVCDRAGGFSRLVIESRWLDGYAVIAPVDGRVRTSALKAGEGWTVEIESAIGLVTLRVSGDIRNLMPFVESGDSVSKGKPIGLAKWGCLCDLTYPLFSMEVGAGDGHEVTGTKGSKVVAGDVLGRVQMIWK